MELWEKKLLCYYSIFFGEGRENVTYCQIMLARHPQPSQKKAMYYYYKKSAIVIGKRSWLLVTARSSCFFSTDTHQIYLSYGWPHSTESWNLNEEKQKVITYFWGSTCLPQNKHIKKKKKLWNIKLWTGPNLTPSTIQWNVKWFFL